jgi:hypothetical protein
VESYFTGKPILTTGQLEVSERVMVRVGLKVSLSVEIK